MNWTGDVLFDFTGWANQQQGGVEPLLQEIRAWSSIIFDREILDSVGIFEGYAPSGYEHEPSDRAFEATGGPAQPCVQSRAAMRRVGITYYHMSSVSIVA